VREERDNDTGMAVEEDASAYFNLEVLKGHKTSVLNVEQPVRENRAQTEKNLPTSTSQSDHMKLRWGRKQFAAVECHLSRPVPVGTRINAE
jgi:hypothetical protein